MASLVANKDNRFLRRVPKDGLLLTRTNRSPSDTGVYDAPAGDT
jgi:hypothetical protein